ncbi:MAG: peptidoglycan DD-metalloendopeptidase family protein [Betaproteobacteria bacterium]|nr:peptidoglycan DD-metalloendopeptidase family protein [Betaproteobacteria bacterium]
MIALLAGCSTRQPAPVVERASPDASRPVVAPQKPAEPTTTSTPASKLHIVQKGETLIAVALQYGLDYRELAAWNNIENVNLIHVGQELRITAPAVVIPTAPSSVVATPLQSTGVPVARPIDAPASGTPDAAGGLVKTGPLAVKVPYSDKALADMEAEAKAGVTGAVSPAAPLAPSTPAASVAKPDEERVDWAWPAKGRVIASYTDANKGIDIAGTLNAPVLAAADGKVMYSGTGIRGYGKLVILKHNSVFLSAYAHNQSILVKEGQDVKKGQRIAEMGATDTDQVKLHFEIRKLGKPVDPAKLLPAP